MSDSDGQNVVSLSNLRGLAAGSPSWSPDSRKIAFDSRVKTPDGQIRADVPIVDIAERYPGN
jgi:Tol biopolymer transport system component